MAKSSSRRPAGPAIRAPAPTGVDVEILLVSASPVVVSRLAEALRGTVAGGLRITPVATLEAADRSLRARHFGVLLIDAGLTAGQDPRMLAALVEAAPTTALLTLAAGGDEAAARAALAWGVQDYVLDSDLDAGRLSRIIDSAVARKQHELEARDHELRACVTLDSMGEAVLSTDLHGHVTYLNRVAEAMTGWSCAQACGRPLTEVFKLVNEITRQEVPDPLQRALREDRAVELASDSVLLHRDGHECVIEDSAAPIRDANGQVGGAVIVFRNVGRLRATARDMAHRAHHDVLTDLPNRVLFSERVSSAIALARRHLRQAALLYLDLDGFKRINDSWGHALGDRLLQSVTERLVHAVRASDTVCRQGGDEFVVLLSEIHGPQAAASSAGKLLLNLAEPHVIDDHTLCVTASIGIALYPRDGIEVNDLLHSADEAMYAAKRRGRNQYQFFCSDLPSPY